MKLRGIRFLVFSVGQVGFSLSHTLAFETDPVGVVDDAVEYGVGDGRLTDHIVPLADGQLGGDERGFSPVAFLEDFQQIEALLIVEAVGAPIVEDHKLDASEPIDETWEAAIEASHGEIFEQARQP